MYTNEILSFIFPILSVPYGLSALKHNTNRWKYYIFLMALFLSVIAYSYIPVRNEPDVVEYFQWIENVSQLSIGEAWNYQHLSKIGLNLFNVICWIIGKTGDYHLLPAISTFFVYYICFYIACDSAKKNGIHLKYARKYIIFAILTLNFYGIANNVRNILAFSLVGLAIYREFYQKKVNVLTIFLYIFPVFLHSSAIIVVIIRLLVMIPGNYKLIFVAATTLIMPITDFLYQRRFIFSGGNVLSQTIRSFINSAYWYYRNGNSGWAIAVANSGSQKMAKVVYICLVGLMCILIFFFQRRNKKQKKQMNSDMHNKFWDVCFYTGLITIACAPMPMPEYWRFASLFFVIGGVAFGPIFCSEQSNLKKSSRMIFLFAPICTVLWMRNLLKCDLFNMFIGVAVMNPFTIMIKDLIYVLFY